MLPPVARNDLITSFLSRPGNEWGQHAELSHTFHRPLHGLIGQHLEGVFFEGMQVRNGNLLNLFGLRFIL